MKKSFYLLMSISLFTSKNLFSYAKDTSSLVNDVITQIQKTCEEPLSIVKSTGDTTYKSHRLISSINTETWWTIRPISLYIEQTINPKITRLHKLKKNLKKQNRLSETDQQKIESLQKDLQEIVYLIKKNELFQKEVDIEFGLGPLFRIGLKI